MEDIFTYRHILKETRANMQSLVRLPPSCQDITEKHGIVLNCPIWYTAKFTLKWRWHSYRLVCLSGYCWPQNTFLKDFSTDSLCCFTTSWVQCKRTQGSVEVIFTAPSLYKLEYSSRCFNFQPLGSFIMVSECSRYPYLVFPLSRASGEGGIGVG